MNRFVIVTFDMEGSMVTFEGSRFTETQQAAILHMVERAGREPVPPEHGENFVEYSESDEWAVPPAAAPVTEGAAAPVVGSAERAEATMRANREAARAHAAERALRARGMGYTGDLCTQCGSDRMKRNGACLCCEGCGATTGCS